MEERSKLTAKAPETAILIGVITSNQTEDMTKEYIDELAFLALTAGVITKKKFLQRIDKPHPKTYIGSGKIEEIKNNKEWFLTYRDQPSISISAVVIFFPPAFSI